MASEIFVGRAQELEELRFLFEKSSASLAVIRGRRRIGKSRLAQEFAKGHRFLQFSGLPPQPMTTAQEQLDSFSRQLSAQTTLPEGSYDDWSKLFQLLALQTNKGRVIILLDEISWMGSKDLNFLGKLKNAWDMQLSKNPELILLLCGSISYWIEENILSSTGFMGRISLDLMLEPLSLKESNQLLIAKGSKANSYEKFKILSVTGGIPRYLEEIKPSLSAEENIRRLCFTKSGILYREFDDIFHDLFTTKSQFYRKLIEILADGAKEYTALCRAMEVKKSGFWARYLDELVQAGFLKQDYTWNLKTGAISRLKRYRLSDNYLRFYIKAVEPNKQRVETGVFHEQAMSSLSGWEGVIGLQFENLVLNHLPDLWKMLHIHPSEVLQHGPYFQNQTKKRRGCQIDYLIKTKSNTLYVCEIKFSKHPLNGSIIEEVQKKMDRLVLPRGHACWPVLIEVNGVSDAVREADFFTYILDFSRLISC